MAHPLDRTKVGESSTGGRVLLYHEVQEPTPSAVHCINTLLQKPLISESDLEAIAAELDLKDRLLLMEFGFSSSTSSTHHLRGDFSFEVHTSGVSLIFYFFF